MLGTSGRITEEHIMNTEWIVSIVQQTAPVMVVIAILYGLQKLIADIFDDRAEAMEKARSQRRLADIRSIEALRLINSEDITLSSFQSTPGANGTQINQKSHEILPLSQISPGSRKPEADERSLKIEMLPKQITSGLKVQDSAEIQEEMSC